MIDRGSPVPSVRVKLVGADGATDTTSDAVYVPAAAYRCATCGAVPWLLAPSPNVN